MCMHMHAEGVNMHTRDETCAQCVHTFMPSELMLFGGHYRSPCTTYWWGGGDKHFVNHVNKTRLIKMRSQPTTQFFQGSLILCVDVHFVYIVMCLFIV